MTACRQLEQKVERILLSTFGVTRGEKLAVAVSGGPDSIAVLAILVNLRSRLGINVSAIHFDHGLRGKSSMNDALFVEHICDEWQIDLCVDNLKLKKATAKQNGLSLQEYARQVRYEKLVELARRMNVTKVALGHTGDDQVETVLMWMIRGAGARGLGGIPLTRQPLFIRPVLGISREEILDYLGSRKLTYCVDHTNLQPIYLRNRIRQELVPLLKKYNPSLINVVSRQADILREEDRFLEKLARESLKHCTVNVTGAELALDRTRLLSLAVPLCRRVVRLAIQHTANMVQSPRFDSVETVLDRVLRGQSGIWVEFNGVHIRREYHTIQFTKMLQEKRSTSVKDFVSRAVTIPSDVHWPLTGQTVHVALKDSFTEMYSAQTHRVLLDVDTFSRPLMIRNWQPGDHFYPLGLQGKRKKLQDYFSDIKLEGSKRAHVPLLVAPEGILWVGGYRLDHRFRVTGLTRRVLAVELSSEVR